MKSNFAKSLMIAATVFVTAIASAALTGNTGLRGYVISFDQKYVWVESGNQKVEVPRKFVPAKVKAGELVTIEVAQSDLDKFKKTTIKPVSK